MTLCFSHRGSPDHDRTRRTCLGALAAWACAGIMLVLGGCANSPKQFDTPDAAAAALISALRADDRGELDAILGSHSEDVLESGDEVADKVNKAEFLRLYDEQHRLIDENGAKTLEVGNTRWPMPIPIVARGDGWSFDTEAGLDELLSRRIGRNELYTIQVCLAVADAQREYASADYGGSGMREYARTFASSPGKRNGLYWPAAPNEPESPLGELVADASDEGYSGRKPGEVGPRPFHGYYYRILTAQGPDAPGGRQNYLVRDRMIGGFGVVAWPVDYGNSGLKTFIISHHGVLYENDLGESTDRIARGMTEFNPGKGWEKADTTVVP